MVRGYLPVACAWVLAGTEPALASGDRRPPWDLSGSIGYTTDYVDRGVSQSDGHGAVHGGLRLQHEAGIYASLWASSVDFADGDEARAEVNYIAGVEGKVRRVELGLGVAYIDYPGADSALQYDLVEISAHAAQPAGAVDLRADAIYSPENAGDSGRALYLRFEVSRALLDTLSIGAHVGRQWIEREEPGGPDYNDFGVRIGWTRGRLAAALAFTDTDGTAACGEICEPGVHATVGLSF